LRTIHVGFSLFETEAQRIAALPLFEAGDVDAVEHTVDVGWQSELPEWFAALLEHYGEAGRLYGHGVSYSPTTIGANPEWLDRLARDPFRYRHVTEHWGFSRAKGLVRGAPMPLVASEAVVQSTIAAMRALAGVARVPVGLEILALAMSPLNALAQSIMITRVLDAIDGVLLLDLHNAWCQAVNFGFDPKELIARYPLDRVRQLHVAGGSWSESAFGAPFRRDTHDALAPDEVFELVAWTIPRCPALEVVILERLPTALDDAEAWRGEWRRLAQVVRDAARAPLVEPPPAIVTPLPADHTVDDVAAFQDAMYATLLAGGDARAVHATLLANAGPFAEQVARWEPRAIEVAIALADKWAVRA
jgi:uncharacterized protein (UPF0276 family)